MGNNVSAELSTERDDLNSPVYKQYDDDADDSLISQNAVVVTSLTGARRSRIEARKHLREELFGSDNTQDSLRKTPVASSKSLNGDVDMPQTSQQVGHATTDTSQAITVDTVLTILKELKKTASPDEILALQLALLPTGGAKSAAVKFNPEAVGPAAAALIRRRSLYTPGLATRTNDKRNYPRNVPSKSQNSPPSKDNTWSSEMFRVASPLEKLAKIDKGRANAYSSLTRTGTPPIHGPTYLGVHNIGSLRITNGEASPEPSLYSVLSHKEYAPSFSVRDDDYYTASEGSAGRRSPEDVKRHSRHPSSTSLSSSSPEELGLSQVSLKEQTDYSNLTSDPLRVASPVRMYLPESKSNPFLPTVEDAIVQTLKACSVSSVDDDENADDTYEPSLITERSKSVYSAKSQTCYSNTQTNVRSEYNEDASQNISLSSQRGPKRPQKPDSGYVSDSSVLTLKTLNPSSSAAAYTLCAIQKQKSNSSLENSLKINNVAKSDWQPHQQISNRESLIELDPYHESISPRKSRLSLKVSKRDASPVDGKPNWSSRSSSQMTPEKLSVSVKLMDDELHGSPTSKPKKETPKKLQKARPKSARTKSEPLIVVQGQSPFFTAPVVPEDVKSKHAGRISKSPGMDHLEHTYKSIAHSKDEEEDGVSIYNVTFRFPSPAPTVEQDQMPPNRRQSALAPETPPHRLLFRKKVPSNDSQQTKSQPNLTSKFISDFGTVVSSLGASPYEISNTYAEGRFHRQNVIHPHQMTAPILRPRSAGMSEKAATEFAMLRSRDRRANLHDYQNLDVHTSASNENGTTPKIESVIRPREQKARPKSFNAATNKLSAIQPIGNSPPQLQKTSNSSKDNQQFSASDLPHNSHETDTSTSSSNENNNSLQKPDDGGWEASARAWRVRRKSIGEGLLRRAHNQEDPVEALVKSSPSTSKPRFYATDRDNCNRDAMLEEKRYRTSKFPSRFSESCKAKPNSLSDQEPTLPSITLNESLPRLKSSLTIRERAALFERPVYQSHKP